MRFHNNSDSIFTKMPDVGLKPLKEEAGLRCRGKDGALCKDVHAHAGNLPSYALGVQLPPCSIASEDAAVANISESLSVVQAFSGATVLVTGGTGYLGSLVRHS